MALPKHLSVSQFTLWTKCPRQHFYRYGEGIIEPPSGAVVIGNCTHSALEYGNRRRAISGKMEPWDTLADVFSSQFKATAPDAIWEEVKPKTARERGLGALRLYHESVAPAIQPAGPEFVERKIEVAFSPRVSVALVLDIVDTTGRVIDYKTTNKRPTELGQDTKFQLWTYRAALGIVAPERPLTAVAAHYLIGSESPDFRELTADAPSAGELGWLVRALETTRAAMEYAYQSGDFPPAPPVAWWCSPRWCGYWERCHRDW